MHHDNDIGNIAHMSTLSEIFDWKYQLKTQQRDVSRDNKLVDKYKYCFCYI